ncbi:MAG: hypothetical protein WCJ30_20255 [Deltaproteobacteria bacterium]
MDDTKPTESTPEGESERGAKPAAMDRPVRALPVIAFAVVMVTVAAIVFVGRGNTRRGTPAHAEPTDRPFAAPTPVRDVDHYVPGSPPAVAERFLRAWMRGRYEDARDLATGEMRARAEHEIQEVGSFNAAQVEEYRHTRAYVDATSYDLEHIEMRDLAPSADGHPRKEVRGQGHAYGAFDTTRVDSRRGQTFVLEMTDGAWRVAERTWETF